MSLHAGITIELQLSGSGVIVMVEAVGAKSVRITLRDSSNRRHVQKGYLTLL